MSLVVAIDGPAASGKSTVAASLADRLDIPHIDTGAYYRAATLAVLRAGVDPDDAEAVAGIVAHARTTRVRGRTLLDGEDVEEAIRGQAVTSLVSQVAAYPQVRVLLLSAQREGIDERGGVVEGRDAGTVVVPDAVLKVWLAASPRERARRRAAQLGVTDPAAVAAIVVDLVRRDAADGAQMRRSPDAVEIDTTGRDIQSLVDDLAGRALARRRPSDC